MADTIDEPFTLVEENAHRAPYWLSRDVLDLTSAKTADHDLQYMQQLRRAFPEMVVTGIPSGNVPLLAFANAGFATYTVDKETDTFFNWRGYTGPSVASREGSLAEVVHFAKYKYEWAGEAFIMYTVSGVQYLLKEKRDGESQLGPSKITDGLIKAVGGWLLNEVVWVFDGYWYQDKALYQQVKKMSWDQVILDEGMKKELTEVATKFFDSKDVYDDLGVPWKRGLMFYGPPGNGKTISIKALMHTLLFNRGKRPIPTLYVKSAPYTGSINSVFRQARALAPCMLILEDVETIVTPQTRSYFFNQMDGLESNDGLLVVGSTNYLDKLDPGLTKRPSRFDRKYLFPLPNEHERTLYCEFWRRKTSHKKDLVFPAKLCPAMARITPLFSFAFLQECFVATLLVLAHQIQAADERDGDGGDNDDDDKDLEEYELWRVFKEQADMLRKQLHSESRLGSSASHADVVPRACGPSVVQEAEMRYSDGRPVQGESRSVLPSFGDLTVQDGHERVARMPGSGTKFELINPAAYMLGR